MKKRIIPCLDLKDGRVVKGKNFKNLQEVADPFSLATNYEKDGADVLFLLDITGRNREQFLQIVKEIRTATSFPLYVGGGIRSLDDIEATLEAGATKVSITSAAIEQPELLSQATKTFGKDTVVLSIDAKAVGNGRWHSFTKGGQVDTGLDAIEWAKRGETLGASEILLNSIDADGVKSGYDIPLTKAVAEAVTIPVIASGGAGKLEDFTTLFTETKAQAALAASVFHFGELSIKDIKEQVQ